MNIKSISLVAFTIMALYSVQTNAASVVKANECTIGLLPFGSTMFDNAKKEQIISAYEAKGFNVSVLSSEAEVGDVEFISDASVECTSTYFGIMAKTTVRLVDSSTNKIIAKTVSPASMELWTCKIDLLTAINALPSCQIK